MNAGVIALAMSVAAQAPDARPPQPRAASAAEAYYQFMLSRHLEGAGDVEAAIAALQRAAGLDPGSAEVRGELASLYARHSRLKDAVTSGEAALEIDPRNLEANRVLGMAYAALADSEGPGGPRQPDPAARQSHAAKAIPHLELARPRWGVDLSVELTLGRLYIQTDAAAKAIAVLTRVLEQEPGAPEVAILLAQAYAGAGQRADAIRTLEDLLGAEPQMFRALALLGDLYEQDRRWADAAETFGRAAEIRPRSVELKARWASALVNAGQAPKARDLLREMVRENPTTGTLLYLLAQAERAASDLEAAEATARRLIALEPHSGRGALALAELYADAGRLEDATRVLEGVAARFPEDTAVLFQLAAVFERQKRFADAERLFQQVLARDPSHAPALNYLGYMLADRGERLEESVAYIQRALAIDPYNGSYLDSLGWAYFKLNRLDLAEANLRKASDQLQSNSVVQDHMGDVLFKLGRDREAMQAWERALAGDGESIDRDGIQTKIRRAKDRSRQP